MSKKGMRILACILATLTFSLCACSAETEQPQSVPKTEQQQPSEAVHAQSLDGSFIVPGKKEELVFVQADTAGRTKEITDRVVLSGYGADDGDFIVDASSLEDVENIGGSEQFLTKNGNLYWENFGESISYEGRGTAEVPVDVAVSYYLDGKKVSADEIRGAEGKIKIRFDYTNKTQGDDYVPFLVSSMVILDPENFYDVDVSDGTVVNTGHYFAAFGYTFPQFNKNIDSEKFGGLGSDFRDYVEITAYTTDFALDFTTTVISNGMSDRISDEGLETFDNAAQTMQEMADGTDTLVSASAALLAGVAEFNEYIQKYASVISDVADTLNEMKSETKDLRRDADIVRDIADVVGNINGILDWFIAAEGVDEWISALDSAIEILEGHEAERIVSVLKKLEEKLRALRKLRSDIGPENIEKMRKALSEKGNIIDQLADYIDDYADMADEIISKSGDIKAASSELSSAGNTLLSQVRKFNSEADRFSSKTLTELADESAVFSEFAERMRLLKQKDSEHVSYSGYSEGTECRVTYMIQTEGIGSASDIIL